MPGLHEVQLDAPTFENVPAEQLVQVDDPYLPAGQPTEADEHDEAPALEEKPVAQEIQLFEPTLPW